MKRLCLALFLVTVCGAAVAKAQPRAAEAEIRGAGSNRDFPRALAKRARG